MASFGRRRVWGRAFLLLAIIFVLLIGGAIWFDFLGAIDIKGVFAPVYSLFGLGARKPSIPADSPTLLDDERFQKLMESVDARHGELDAAESALDLREEDIVKRLQEIEDRSKTIEEREKSFNELLEDYENRRANIEQNARYLMGMPPDKAVAILAEMDDQTVIDILRMVEELARAAGEDSVVAYWLSLLPAERSAAIQRKMALKPGS